METGTTIHTILQCFVDVNLNTDENSTYSTNLLEVSFDQPVYNFDEGTSVEVGISLSAPSVDGYEEVEVGIVLNNTSSSDISTLGEIYPQSISFSAGQQSQTIKFFANTDLLEEGTESFDVILGFFTNTVPGQYITTTVNIIDKTNLKEVFFDTQGNDVGLSTTNNKLTFTALEGSSKIIKVSLDSPSVLGVESVDVQLTNLTTSTNDYTAFATYNLSWAIGQQHKFITISTNQDNEIEDDENLQLTIVNPGNVNIISPSEAILNIIDGSPEPLYATINLQATYVQFGSNGSQNVEMRWVKKNVEFGSSEPGNNRRRFIKYGVPVSVPYTYFNPPLSSSYSPVLGSNSIGGWKPNTFQSFQNDAVIFFGEKPSINFGIGSWSVTNSTKIYGDLKLKVKNVGSHTSIVNGNSLSVNDFTIIPVNSLSYILTLPANNGLLVGGTIYNGNPLPEDTLTQCLYEFTFIVDFEELNFKLRDAFNSVSSNKEINIGTHLFNEVYTLADSILPANLHNLITEYNNVWPYWESNYQWPQQGPYCLPAASLGNQNQNGANYPLSTSDLQNVKIDGIAFLHQQASIQNSTSTTKTSYNAFYFLPSGQTSSGCASVDIEYNGGPYANPPFTASIPFKVI